MPATPRRTAWTAAALVTMAIPQAAAQGSAGDTAVSIQTINQPRTVNRSGLPTSFPRNLPPPGPPPVQLAVTTYNPGLHQLTWGWDGVHGVMYYQVYRIDPQHPGGTLLADRLSQRGLMDSTFLAPGTTYRVVAFYPDNTRGTADYVYANPPQPVAPGGFAGMHWGAGSAKLTWQPVPAAAAYRLLGPALPAQGVEVDGSRTSHLVTGLPPGNHTFSIATRYRAGTSGVATAIVPVRATSGNYRVLLTGVKSQSETRDDPLDFDGKRDEIYAAAYWAQLPYWRDKTLASAVVQTKVYGDVNQASYRIQAGSGSPLGGIKAGDVIPNGFHPVPQPGAPAYNDRFPLLVWQGTLQDSGQIVVVNPTVWESDRNSSSNLPGWVGWWGTPNGGAILRDVAYANRGVAAITPVWIGYRDDSGFPFQPGMSPGQGLDRPVGMNRSPSLFASVPNANSFGPLGLVLTRERIERALGPSASATIIPIQYRDSEDLAGSYMVFVQIERTP